MDDLLQRLKRERRWAVLLFIVAVAVIAAIQFGIAPESQEVRLRPAAVDGTSP